MNKATETPNTSQGERIEDRIVSRIYDVALDPMNYGELLDDWEELIAPVRRNADRTGPLRLPRADLGVHFRRLADILDRAERDNAHSPEESELAPYRRVVAFCVTRNLQAGTCNDVTRALYGLNRGGSLDRMPMAPEDVETLKSRIRELFCLATDESRLLRLHVAGDEPSEPPRPILFRLRRVTPADGRTFVIVVTSHLYWPLGLSDTLARSFRLTGSEIEVLRGLTQSQTPREIADRRNRSVETVRAQIKSLQQKTETRSQGDLVRLALSAMDVADPSATDAEASEDGRWSGGGRTLKLLPIRQIRRPDGRRVDYIVLGSSTGRPVVYLSSLLNLLRWPAKAEAEAARRNIRIIVPIRPGYFNSTPLTPDSPRIDTVADDIAGIADAERAERFPMVVMGQDANYAAAFNRRHPGRLRGVIGCGATLPSDQSSDYDRMGKWHRFIYSSVRYTPHLVPFMIRTGLAMARRSADGDFLRTVMAESPSDIAVLRDPDLLEAIMAGTEPMLKFRGTADAVSAELRLNHIRCGDQVVEHLRGDFPVIMLHGKDDLHTPPAALEEKRRAFPEIRFEQFDDAGVFLLFTHWRHVLDLTEELTNS